MALEGLSRGIFRSLGFLRSKRRLNEEELKEMTKSLRRACLLYTSDAADDL